MNFFELTILVFLSIAIVLRVISIISLRRDLRNPFMLRLDSYCMDNDFRLVRYYWKLLKSQKCQYYMLSNYCAIAALAYFSFGMLAPLLLIVFGAISTINWYTLKSYVARVSPQYLFLFEDV